MWEPQAHQEGICFREEKINRAMTEGYGSENEGAAKVAILDLSPDVSHVKPQTSKIKRAAICVGVALAVVGALVAFQATTTDHSLHAVETVKSQKQQQQQQPQPVALAQALAKAKVSQAAYSTDNPVLTSGQEFMIVCAKEGKCVDDGGGTTSGSTKLYLVTCDPLNKNQRFVYDAANNAIRNPSKNNLCWNDDGSRNSGFTLKTCDPNSADTKFVYDWINRAIKVPTKSGQCVDGGGTFDHRTCDPSRDNQRFEIVPQAYW